jgi:hypothetical protein
MRRQIVRFVAIGFMLGVVPVWAYEGEGHGAGHPAEPASRSEPAGVQKITGEVVDLACYLSHGEMGEKHRECATKCIQQGLPVGIKSGETVYLAVSSEHTASNSTLAPLAAKQVTAEGEVTERNGIRLIAIKKVTVNP